MSLPAPRAWLRLPRRTARLRLTLLYAGSFLLLGTVVIAITYVLASGAATVSVQAHPVRTLVSPPNPSFPDPALRSAILGGAVSQRSADTRNLLEISWLVMVITALAAAVFGWFASGRVLRPLREMTDTARTISAGNLSERLALSGPDDEFKRLGDTLDELLGRLEASFESQRRFVANASHELRTPLTLERTLLQVALSDPNATVDSLRATCQELLTSGRDQERLLESLLTLASSERALDRLDPLDLAVLAEQVLQRPRPEAQERGLTISPSLSAAPMRGDPALVERLIANLLDNALRYNEPGGRVAVRTETSHAHSVLSVSNTGPIVAPEQVRPMFEPFYRLEGRRYGGDGHHGLGLSIVNAIATAHGADVDAQPQPTGGLAVTVSFPARDGPPA